MFRVFSGSCLTLEDMETVVRPNLVERPHILGPGADYFTNDGEPLRPQPGAHTLQKVFSGSTLDLNAFGGDAYSDEEQGEPVRTVNGQAPRQTLPVSTILNQLSSETAKERVKSVKSRTNVLVIAENGYLGSHVVAKLLKADYSVRLATSNPVTQQQQAELYKVMSVDVASRLSIANVDINNSIALRDVIRGCRYIIHCGCSNSAVDKKKGPVAYHMDAIQALFDGIRLAGKASVKRVVLTGAATSVFHIRDALPPSGKFDERCWNTVANSETDPIPYAKIVFEKEAWRLRQMLGVELVVLLPSSTIGPSRTEETSDAMMMIQGLANAPSYFPFCPKLYWNYVDVCDVAEAHVRAMESPEAKDQRIIISNACLSLAEVSRIIKKQYPHLNPPTRSANKLLTLLIYAPQSVNLRFLWRNLGERKPLDNRRAIEELGMQFTDIEKTIGACVEELMAAKAVPTPNDTPEKSFVKLALVTLGMVGLVGAVGLTFLRKRKH
ncbi:unnamed protein product [Phytomonas sp. EM1]|nr:unnamed protein product [Phytomonas sp. EM1]|eukprot:CCW60718.1 unnamed protein product [Phytomonas sp. isolate EM1]